MNIKCQYAENIITNKSHLLNKKELILEPSIKSLILNLNLYN